MKKVLRAIDRTSESTMKLASFLIIPLTLVVVYTVIMRYFFKNAPDWGFEVPIFIYGIYFMVAGAGGLRDKVHVSVDIFPSMLPKKGKFILNMITQIIIIVVCITLVWQGYESAWGSTLIKERSTHQSSFNPQIWWFKWVIPISAFLILLQSIRELIGEIFKFLEKEEDTNA